MAWKKGKYKKKAPGQMKRWSAEMVRTPSNTDTTRARILGEDKLGGWGASVLYRDHVRSGGRVYVTRSGKVVLDKPKAIPKTRLVFSEYLHVKEEDKPPLVQVIEKRMQSKENQSSNNRYAGFENWLHYDIKDEPYYRLIACFSGNKTFFLEHDQIMLTLKMSRDYTSERAREIVRLQQFARIDWIRSDKLPPPPDPS